MNAALITLDKAEHGYTVFELNQVLKPEQLNSLAAYLDDQQRLTRVALIGVGIACGLWPSLEGEFVRLTHGVGTTTDGDLVLVPKEVSYDALPAVRRHHRSLCAVLSAERRRNR